jgi:hypothetical protein
MMKRTLSTKKRKGKGIKKRSEYIYATVEAKDGKIEVTYDSAKGGIEVSNLIPGTLHQRISYSRDSGKEKVLSSTPCLDDIGRFGGENLLKNFDYLFAVDTNTKIIDGERTSVCMSYHVPEKLNPEQKICLFVPFLVFEINDVMVDVNPETVGWQIIIRQIIKSPAYASSDTIGLIVDSELGKIQDINSGKVPYYHKLLLPPNIKLIYASSDSGKEFLPNMMIDYCEKGSNLSLAYLEKNHISLNKNRNGDDYFRGFRQLRPK